MILYSSQKLICVILNHYKHLSLQSTKRLKPSTLQITLQATVFRKLQFNQKHVLIL